MPGAEKRPRSKPRLLSIYIDTNCINARQKDPALNELEALHDKGLILIEKADVLETELMEGKGYPAGIRKSHNFTTSFGPAVIGHSRIGSCIIGSDRSATDHQALLALLFGEGPYSKNDVRDVMHLLTVAHYMGDVFVTNEQAILQKAVEIEQMYRIKAMNPGDCSAFVRRHLAR